MDIIKKRFTLGFVSIALLSLLMIGVVYAASSGSYTSESIGEADVTSFKTLELIDQNKPEGTEIKYSFAGSKDNYATWSNETTVNKNFDLSGVEELKSGGYMKVKITLVSTTDSSPSLKGFKVTYVKSEGETGTYASPVSTVGTSSTNTSNSESKTSIAKLVSTGANLWLNILIALLLATGIAYFLVWRKKK